LKIRFIHVGILIAFLLIPVWYRIPKDITLIPSDLYVVRFLLFLVALWTIFWWLAAGLPGFAQLRREPMRALWALMLLTLALLGFASNLWAFQRIPHPEVAATNALQLGVSALFALVVACAAPPPRHIITALMIGLLWNAGLALLQVMNQGSFGLESFGERSFEAELSGVSVVMANGVRWIRPYGLLPHPNIFAGFMAITLLACIAWLLNRKTINWWAGTSILLFGLFALLLTFSRGAWLGFATGAATILVLIIRSRLPLPQLEIGITAACTLLVGVVFFLVFQPFLLARAGVTTEAVEQRSVASRVIFASFAMQAVTEFPLLGVGIGNFPWRASYYLMDIPFDMRGDSAHNIYLSAWAELGTIGFIVFLGAIVAGILAFLKISSPSPTTDASLSQSDFLARITLFGGFIALCATGIFDHYNWSLFHFQVLWWGVLAAAISPQLPGISISGSALHSPAASTISDRTHMPSASIHQVSPAASTARASGLADSSVSSPPRTG
jgi:O-antigen ligase